MPRSWLEMLVTSSIVSGLGFLPTLALTWLYSQVQEVDKFDEEAAAEGLGESPISRGRSLKVCSSKILFVKLF